MPGLMSFQRTYTTLDGSPDPVADRPGQDQYCGAGGAEHPAGQPVSIAQLLGAQAGCRKGVASGLLRSSSMASAA